MKKKIFISFCVMSYEITIMKMLFYMFFNRGKMPNNVSIKVRIKVCCSRLPNARMLNIWLNIKKNCSMKKIKNQGMSCNSILIPAFVVFIRAQKVFSLGHIYFSRDKHIPVEIWYTYFTRNVNLTKRENFLTSNLYHKRRNA